MIIIRPELVCMPRKIDVERRNEERPGSISHESQKTGKNSAEYAAESHSRVIRTHGTLQHSVVKQSPLLRRRSIRDPSSRDQPSCARMKLAAAPETTGA